MTGVLAIDCCENCGGGLDRVSERWELVAVRCTVCGVGGHASVDLDGRVVGRHGPALDAEASRSVLLSDSSEPVRAPVAACASCDVRKPVSPRDGRCVACRDADGLVGAVSETVPVQARELVTDGGKP